MFAQEDNTVVFIWVNKVSTIWFTRNFINHCYGDTGSVDFVQLMLICITLVTNQFVTNLDSYRIGYEHT